MEYTINKLSKMAGVSARTLRYYDEIGLLKPLRTSSAGYRIYGAKEVDTLQQILFYRHLGYGIKEIEKLLHSKNFDQLASLKHHLSALLDQKQQLEQLIDTVNKTISKEEGKIHMKDNEKFRGFKARLIEENERTYGEEIRAKYGSEAVESSSRKLMGLSEQQYNVMSELEARLKKELLAAVDAGEAPDGETGMKIASLHKEWLSYSWTDYSLEAHRNLGRMYVEDPRFTAYYDGERSGCAAFLRDAIAAYVGSVEEEPR